jgi:hypothetical protein
MLPIQNSTQFLKEVVEPDYHEAIHNPLSLRHAYHLAVGLFSLRDWVLLDFSSNPGWPYGRNKMRFQKELEGLCPEFSIISEVTHSARNLRLQKMKDSLLGVDRATIYLGSSTATTAGGDGAEPAHVTLDAGHQRLALLDAGEQVFFMWKELFRKSGWR